MELKERLSHLFESGDLTSYLKEDTDYKSLCSKIGAAIGNELFGNDKQIKSFKRDDRHDWEIFRFVPAESVDPTKLSADTLKTFIDNLGKEFEVNVGTAKAPKTVVAQIEELPEIDVAKSKSDLASGDANKTFEVVNSFYSKKRPDTRCSSNKYLSAELKLTWYNKDDPNEKEEHCYYACVASAGIKAYTPNAALKKSKFNLVEASTPESLIKIKDEQVKQALIALINAANSSKYTKAIEKELGKSYEYLTCEKGSTCPGDLIISYQSDNVEASLKEVRPELVNAMSIDFAEVFGAVVVARALSNALGEPEATTFIEFPKASNEPIIDYYIILKNKGVKFSAKTGAGGSPSSTGLINSIHEKIFGSEEHKDQNLIQYYKDNPVTKSFFDDVLVKCIKNAKDKDQSYLMLAEEMIGLLEGSSDKDWQKPVIETLAKANGEIDSVVDDWYSIKDLAEKGEDIEQQEDLARNIYDKLMYLKRDVLKLKTMKGSPKKVDDPNPKTYWKNNAVSSLVKILVALINATPEVIDSFNELFNLSFGRFCQIYFDNKNIKKGEFEYKLVFTGADGQELKKGDTIEQYEFVQNCGQNGRDGSFANQYLAVVMSKKVVQ